MMMVIRSRRVPIIRMVAVDLRLLASALSGGSGTYKFVVVNDVWGNNDLVVLGLFGLFEAPRPSRSSRPLWPAFRPCAVSP
jgi:hypothetical protein